MSNNLNKVHYCIEINTGYTEHTNSNIGMEGGIIRYVTDNVDIGASTHQYEDGTAVDGVWYKDIVSRNGFAKLGSRIDIITGGDYAYLQSFNLSLVNHTANGRPYHKELQDEGINIIGATVKIYVIIDNVLYSRWVGVVGESKFTDDVFTYQCNDAHNNKNNTVKNTLYGMVKKFTLNDVAQQDNKDDVRPVTQRPITRLKPFRTDGLLDQDYRKFNSCLPVPEKTHWDWLKLEAHTGTSITSPIQNDFDTKMIEMDSQVLQVWIQYTDTIYLEGAHYVTIQHGTDESEPYNILGWFHDEDDSLLKVLIKGNVPIDDADSQFGNWENISDPAVEASLKLFDDTFLNVYNIGVKINDTIDLNDVSAIFDKNGVEIPLDTIFEFNGDYYLPNTIVTKAKYDIPNSDIQYTYGDTGNYDGMVKSDFNLSFNGEFQPTQTEPYIKSYLDLSKVTFDVTKYDTISLGINYVKSIKELSFPAQAGCAGCMFGFRFNESSTNTDVIINPDGTTTNINGVNKSSSDLKSSLAGLCKVDIVPTYEDAKYGMVPVGVNSYNATLPVGFNVTTTPPSAVDTPDGNYIFHNSGTTNLPYELYTIDPVRPRILSGKGIPTWININSEASFFDAKYGSSETTIPNIKDSVAKSKDLILVITSNIKNSVDIYKVLSGNVIISDTIGVANEVVSPNIQMGFSLVGYTETNTSDGFFGSYIDEDTNTIGEILGVLSDTTAVNDIRPTYFAGRFIEEQTSKFNMITEICKQSFIGGYTNRLGDVEFKKIMEYSNDYHNHNDNNIVDKSIKSFQLSPISKVYNEFEVKYCYVDNKPEKTLEVHNVDEDIFPDNVSEVFNIPANGTGAITFYANFYDPLYIIQIFTHDWVVFPDIGGVANITADTGEIARFTIVDIQGDTVIGSLDTNPLYTNIDMGVTYNSTTDKVIYDIPVDTMLADTYPYSGLHGNGLTWTSELMSGDDLYANYPSGTYMMSIDGNNETGTKDNTPPIGTHIIANICEYYMARSIRDLGVSMADWDFPTVNTAFSYGSAVESHVVLEADIIDIIYFNDNVTLVLGNVTHSDSSGAHTPDTGYRIRRDNIMAKQITRVSIDNSEVESTPEWKKWVVGIDDYNTAKDIWDKAHQAYLYTKVVQKTPSNRTNLKWAVDRNWFFDTDIYNSLEEYGYDYFLKLLDWTSYQKYQVNYSLPITDETIKYEILDEVHFSDPIVTPDVGEYGIGWITQYEVDTKKDIVNMQLTFEPAFLRIPHTYIRPCINIWEGDSEAITITETGNSNDININEPCERLN